MNYLGAARARIFSPDARPLIASQWDDEFDGAAGTALNARWSLWDASGANILTAAHDGKGSALLTIATGTTRMVGPYQPVPAVSEYSIYTKCAARVIGPQDSCGIGLFLSENLASAPSTADSRWVETSWFTSSGFGVCAPQALRPTAYNSTGVAAGASRTANFSACYFRIRVNGTTWGCEWSTDGQGWVRLLSETITITPVHMGIAGFNSNTGISVVFAIEFFRVFVGAGAADFGASHIGRVL